jgi:hypothetical protein
VSRRIYEDALACWWQTAEDIGCDREDGGSCGAGVGCFARACAKYGAFQQWLLTAPCLRTSGPRVSNSDCVDCMTGALHMNFDQNPKPSYGFIYVLGNKSMPGIYKVGLTTNSVRQRATELSSTGVPTEFYIEQIFEIDQALLRLVEKESHSRLKTRNFHQGKEFFKAPVNEIIAIVEDVILSKTGIRAPDIVGLAMQRAEDEARRARESHEAWRKQQLERQEREKIERQEREKTIQISERRRRERDEFFKKSVAEADQYAYAIIRQKTEKELGYGNNMSIKNISSTPLLVFYIFSPYYT